ncbi:MAG: tetratricopeptide repeat protein [Cyanobacteria bacterium REEB67]|nr:tetratricopeptide repeat protein [Cyanobacteria bacterium REEB67]
MRASFSNVGPALSLVLSLLINFAGLLGPTPGGWAGSAMARTHKVTATHSSKTSSKTSAKTAPKTSSRRSSIHASHGSAMVVSHGHSSRSHSHGHVVTSHGGRSGHVGHATHLSHPLGKTHAAANTEPVAKKHENSDIDDSQAQAQAAAEAQPRLRNYSLLGNAYALYDQGVNERLKGNYGLSTDKLSEAAKLIDQASSIERSGKSSTLSAMVFYELGLAAEADNELSLARDSFVHAVKAKPGYVEAYLHLVNVLATGGHLQQARNWLNDAVRECPNDGRLSALQSKLAGFMGGDAGEEKSANDNSAAGQ